MKNSKSPLLVKFAAIATAITLSGAAFAVTPVATAGSAAPAAAQGTTVVSPDQQKGGDHHKRMRRHHREIGMWVPGYGPLTDTAVQSLALNDSQVKLLADAKTAQKEQRTAGREAMKTARAAKLEQLKSGKIDPRAAIKASEAIHQKAAGEHKKDSEKWLAVWDSLDAAQQQKVAAYFSQRAEKKAEHAKKHPRQERPAEAAKASS